MTTQRAPTAASSERTGARGSVREVAVLAYPVVLTQISVTAMQLVDSAMVGSLGASELAAVGFSGIWMWTFLCFFMGASNGVQTFVSQYFGAGNERDCGSWTWQALYAIGPMAIGIAAAIYFGAGAFVAWLAPSTEVQGLATDYLAARSLGCAAMVATGIFGAFFRGLGDTKTPLYITVCANVINAVLDYGLIFGELGLPELGVYGAGLATSAAEWIALACSLAAFWRPRTHRRFDTGAAAPSASRIRRLLHTGLPIGGQWLLEMSSFAAFTTLVARMGDAPMAASQAFIVLLSISFMQISGVSMAVSTLVGQYIGARDPDAVEHAFRSGLRLGGAIALVVGLLFVALPGPLVRLFSADPAVLALARPLLMVGAAYQVFDAVAIVTDGALRGGGDTRWPLVIRFALSWGLFLPLAYSLGVVLDLGLTGAWSGGVVQVAVLAAMLFWRFRSGAWRRIQI